MPTAKTNGPYADRIVLNCSPAIGPFVQAGPLGNFDPIRDLEVYVDGVLTPIRTWAFDTTNNRYLLYMDRQINIQGIIQLVHHMPDPPFQFAVNPPLFDLTPGSSPGTDGGGI